MKFDIIYNNLNFLLEAMGVTIKITLLSFIFAIIIAFVIGTLRSESLPKIIDFILYTYIEIFRGTPLLIQLFFIYYGLPSIGINISNTVAAILGLSLNSGAYMSEIIRASILSVDKGQKEAAFVLGYSKFKCFLHIIYPQAIRISIPTLMNSFSGLLKESSLISVLAINELTRCGNLIYTRTYRAFEIYLFLGVSYFIMTYIVSLISKTLEKKLNRIYQNN